MLNLDSMMAQAKTFCTIQPCTRFAEGDIVVESDAGVERIAVCPRHYEYYVSYFGGDDFDRKVLSKETVFVDDISLDSVVDDVIKKGEPHEIVRPR